MQCNGDLGSAVAVDNSCLYFQLARTVSNSDFTESASCKALSGGRELYCSWILSTRSH